MKSQELPVTMRRSQELPVTIMKSQELPVTMRRSQELPVEKAIAPGTGALPKKVAPVAKKAVEEKQGAPKRERRVPIVLTDVNVKDLSAKFQERGTETTAPYCQGRQQGDNAQHHGTEEDLLLGAKMGEHA